MNDDRPKRERMPIEEATVSNIWAIVAIVKALEWKGLGKKQDRCDVITEFLCKTPCTSMLETVFPEPYLLTETENPIIDDIPEMPNENGLASHAGVLR
jgi:hypothetical protein